MAHYDKHNRVDDYVYYYLRMIGVMASEIIFVTVADIDDDDKNKLSNLGVKVIVRDNLGYDFYSYKTGIKELDLNVYDELIICNDSVYGPLFDLSHVFSKMDNDGCDCWGVTDSNEIEYHMQSYFIVFRKSILDSEVFRQFWDNVQILNDKTEIIKKYEIGLSKLLISSGFNVSALLKTPKLGYVSALIRYRNSYLSSLRKIFSLRFYQNFFTKLKGINKVNVSHFDWEEMIVKYKFPFIKIELLRDNPCRIKNTDKYQDVISSVSEYPTNLIDNHLKRILS